MEKKVIFITGTNSGFGYLTATSLAGQGHTVYGTVRESGGKNKERAEELSATQNMNVLDVDVTNSAQVNAAINQIIEKEGKLDVVVNNAGYFGGGIAETYAVDDLERMFDVNVKGVWRVIKAALPQMRKQGEGLIINISSSLGRFSAPFMTVYNSTKFAVEGLSEGLHYEVKPLGVDVALIQPGAFPTEIFAKVAYGSDQSVNEGYGELAKVPEQIGEGMGKLFEAVKPDPQLIADAIHDLIKKPKGERPLRTTVDPATGEFVKKANAEVASGFKEFTAAFGMQELTH